LFDAVRSRRGRRLRTVGSALLALAAGLHGGQISTIAGNGQPGFSATQINNPYGLTIGPDGALYFCEIGNHVIRRLDLATHVLTVIAGNGTKGYSGDGGLATQAQLNEPYEVRFDSLGNMFFVDMRNNAVRRVDVHTKQISTISKDFNQPHSLAFDVDGALLVCDIGNKRIQRLDLQRETTSTFLGLTFAGPRAITIDPGGLRYLALREGNAIGALTDKFVPFATVKSPKGMSYAEDYSMYVADSEDHRILNVDLVTHAITTSVGTGERGDGPDGDPLQCKLARPHGVLAVHGGTVYIADSENHRIRMLVYSVNGRIP
jgi:DNA-binding beta-propeller fold protein YncE